MKLKIKVKYFNNNCKLTINPKGDWIDLRAAYTIALKAPQASTLKRHKTGNIETAHRDVKFDSNVIPLGFAMKLPKGFEAVVLPRSSSYYNFGIILGNNQGVIDNCYQGESDQWRFNAIAFRDTVIKEGDRIGQFRIQLSQKATVLQKLRWLFSSGIKIKEVNKLNCNSRGGFGTTGIN